MDEDVRLKKEDIIKNKLENEDVDLSALSDDEINKVVTPEAEKEVISQATQVENLDSLSDEDIDKLFGSIDQKEGEGLTEAIEKIVNTLKEKNTPSQKIIESMQKNMGFKESEAKDLYDLYERKETFIEKAYRIFEGVEVTPNMKDLMDLTGEKVEGTLDIPDLEYACKEEAKKIPEPVDITEQVD